MLLSNKDFESAFKGQPTHAKRSQAISKVPLSFHLAIRDAARATENPTGPLGKYSLGRIANVDQTPLPFCFTDGPTYEDTGSSTVWVRSGAYALKKQQNTIQLTIFSDGEPRVKPLVIFRGKGQQNSLAERVRYDTRVTVCFQPNAWCEEATMGRWSRDCWKPNTLPDTSLIADIHRAQTINAIKDLLRECNTDLVLVPAGCTSLVQPINIAFNKPFKSSIEKLAMQHMHDHLHDYLTGKLSSSVPY